MIVGLHVFIDSACRLSFSAFCNNGGMQAATRIPIVPKHKLGSRGHDALAEEMILSDVIVAYWRQTETPSPNHVHGGVRSVAIRCYDIT